MCQPGLTETDTCPAPTPPHIAMCVWSSNECVCVCAVHAVAEGVHSGASCSRQKRIQPTIPCAHPTLHPKPETPNQTKAYLARLERPRNECQSRAGERLGHVVQAEQQAVGKFLGVNAEGEPELPGTHEA